MFFRRINQRLTKSIAFYACCILILYLIFTPLIYIQSSEVITVRNSQTASISGQNSFGQNRRVSLITAAATENLMLTDAVIYHVMNRNQQVSRQMINLVSYAFAILLSGYGILVHNSRCVKQRMNHRPRILAGSLGGHAPPVYGL